jgi:hypothetical protein
MCVRSILLTGPPCYQHPRIFMTCTATCRLVEKTYLRQGAHRHLQHHPCHHPRPDLRVVAHSQQLLQHSKVVRISKCPHPSVACTAIQKHTLKALPGNHLMVLHVCLPWPHLLRQVGTWSPIAKRYPRPMPANPLLQLGSEHDYE